MNEPRFVFVVVRAGSEPLAKAEIARVHPDLRLSFSRPGLLTLKDPSGALGERFGAGLVFSRIAGLSLGLADGVDAIVAKVPDGKFVLQVVARAPSGESLADPVTAAVEEALRAQFGDRASAGPAKLGDRVLDVVVAPGEPSLVGLHVHAERRWPAPLSLLDVAPREGAPSRAHKKLDEALLWSGAVMHEREVALELGAAPGGMTLALLSRGVGVVAVDPAEMSPEVLAFTGPGGARADHKQVAAGAVRVEDLPALDWVVVDLNLAPPVALRYLARIVRARMPKHGAFITLKLNDAAMVAQIPEHLERIRGMGFPKLAATQLPSNRSEITVFARP